MQPQPFLQQQSSPRHEEAPFWARNLQGNVFHLFYLSFLAGLEDLLLRLTTSLFMDFNQVCQAATTTTICLSLDLAPKISLTCAVVLEFQRLAGKYVWSSCENWQDRYHYDSHYLVWIFRYKFGLFGMLKLATLVLTLQFLIETLRQWLAYSSLLAKPPGFVITSLDLCTPNKFSYTVSLFEVL